MQKDMKIFVIESHNDAGRILAEDIQIGALSDCLMVDNVGKAINYKAIALHGSKFLTSSWLTLNRQGSALNAKWFGLSDDGVYHNSACTGT